MSVTENEDTLPLPRRPRRRNDDALPMRHEYRSPGKVQVFCFILGAWRVVYTDDDRSKAEAWAHENIRREDGTVSAIELRERGNDSALDYGCTDVSARSRVSAVMRRLRSRLERQQESQKKLQALLHRLTKPG